MEMRERMINLYAGLTRGGKNERERARMKTVIYWWKIISLQKVMSMSRAMSSNKILRTFPAMMAIH